MYARTHASEHTGVNKQTNRFCAYLEYFKYLSLIRQTHCRHPNVQQTITLRRFVTIRSSAIFTTRHTRVTARKCDLEGFLSSSPSMFGIKKDANFGAFHAYEEVDSSIFSSSQSR